MITQPIKFGHGDPGSQMLGTGPIVYFDLDSKGIWTKYKGGDWSLRLSFPTVTTSGSFLDLEDVPAFALLTDGRLTMDQMPADFETQLSALIDAQKQTNELLFMILQQMRQTEEGS